MELMPKAARARSPVRLDLLPQAADARSSVTLDLLPEEEAAQSGYQRPVTVDVQDGVAVLRVRRGENRVNLDFVQRMNAALDEVESNPSVRALVTTGEGKFYNNGLDLDWLLRISSRDPKLREDFTTRCYVPLHRRLLLFPVPTIAAINGHCFAAGAQLSLNHDVRLMRADRGWWCFNEVHTGVRNSAYGLAVIRCKVPVQMITKVLVLGERFTGPEMLAAGLVDEVTEGAELLPRAVALAGRLGELGIPRQNLADMKADVYASVVRAAEGFGAKM